MTAVDGEVQELNERVDEGLSGVGGEVRGLSQPLTIRLPDKTSIEIEACREELILDLKHVLTEVLPTCFYTNYKFSHNNRPVSELSDIRSLLPADVPNGEPAPAPILDIIPERYGERALKLHVRRVRELLQSPEIPLLSSNVVRPPQSMPFSRDEGAVLPDDTPADEKMNPNKKNKKKKKKRKTDDTNKTATATITTIRKPMTADPEYFASFLAGSPPMFDAKLDIIDRVVKCGDLVNTNTIKELTYSSVGIKKPPCFTFLKSNGWNPPTSQWRLVGDLWYLELVTLESKCLAIIGQETGFIIASETSGVLPINSNWWNPSVRPKKPVLGVDKFWTIHDLLKAKSPQRHHRVSVQYVAALAQLSTDMSVADPSLSYRISSPFIPNRDWVVDATEPSIDFCRLENALERGTGCDVWDATREWNEELQYSRELPRTDANLFSNQNQMRHRNRNVRRQQHYEMQGAPFSVILERMKEEEQNNQPFSNSSSNGALFGAEDAAIIRDRNLCKFSSSLKSASAQGAINIREGKIVALGNSEDQLMPVSNVDDEGPLKEVIPLDEVKVYAWHNLFLVQASEVPEAQSEPSVDTAIGESSGVSQYSASTNGSNDESNIDSHSHESSKNNVTDSCLATYFCTRRGMLADVRASELLGAFDSVNPVAFGNSIKATGSPMSTAPSTPSTFSEKGQSSQSCKSSETMLSIDASRTANLYSLVSSLVDYAGERTLCQTIIPGMLSGELNSRPVFGVASLGEPYTCDPSARHLLEEYVQRPLGLKSHLFRDCTGKEISTPVPVECKVLQGADHRRYLSDMGRVLPVDLNWFTAEEIDLLIHAKNSTTVGNTEEKLRHQIAKKNSGVLVRPEVLSAYLYQASKKSQMGENGKPFDWSKYRLEIPEKNDARDREIRAKAAFEWERNLGLYFFPAFMSHVCTQSDQSNESDPMTEWPGLEMFFFNQRFQWSKMPSTIQQIAQCIAHKVTALYLNTEDPRPVMVDWAGDEIGHPSVDEDILKSQSDRWGLTGEYRPDMIPLGSRDILEFHNSIRSATQQAKPTDESSVDQLRIDGPSGGDSLSQSADIPIGPNDGIAGIEKRITEVVKSFMVRRLCSGPISGLAKHSISHKVAMESYENKENEAETESDKDGSAYSKKGVPCVPELFNCNISNLCVDLIADKDSRRSDVLQLQNIAVYIKSVALPRLVDHLVGNMDDTPLESGSISELFHAFGVNMRYLGCVLSSVKERLLMRHREYLLQKPVDVEQNEEPMEYPLLVEVLERELLTRCVTYKFNSILVKYPMGNLAEVTAYLFNVLISPPTATINRPELDFDSPSLLTPEEFWSSISHRCAQHFNYPHLQFPSQLINVLHHCYPVIRAVCRKVGIQLTPAGVAKIMKCVAGEYDLSNNSALSSILKSTISDGTARKNGTTMAKRMTASKTSKFDAVDVNDVYGFVPVIQSEPWSPSVSNVSFAAGVAAHSLDLFEVAFECHQQCVQISHQMNLPVSKEVMISQCCTAFVLMNVGDVLSSLVYFQKVILLVEKLQGPDHPCLIHIYFMLAKLSMAIIAAPDSIQTQSSSSSSSHQLFIQLHHLNICKNALEKAVTLAKLWTGVTYKSPILPQLLIQSAKVALTSMSFLGILQHQATSVRLEDFGEATQKAIRATLSTLPTSASSPILADADRILSILFVTSEIAAAMRKGRTSSLHTIAQLESELTAQYLSAGETRRALDSARRHRDVLVELLGAAHINIELLGRQISALTRQAVIRAKRERLMLRGLELPPSLSSRIGPLDIQKKPV